MIDKHYDVYCVEGRYRNLLVRYTADTYTKIMYYARKLLKDFPQISSVCVRNHKGNIIKVVTKG